MMRFSWSCLVLFAFLVSGCGIIQDSSSSQQSGISTPKKATHKKETTNEMAARRAAAQQQAAKTAPPQALANKAEPVKVAVLVPLSGKSAALGQSMVNAAQLAVFDMGSSGFELLPRDTKGTTDGAVQASRDAIASGAQLLIGPLFAADVAAVKPAVRNSGISMLALSTDVSLAETSAYVMGFAPAPQVERVVAFATSRGLHNFAAIIPAGPYGQLVSKAFDAAVKAAGGTLVAKEGTNNVAALGAQKEKIEAIFVPLGGDDLRKVAVQLAAVGFEVGRVRLLGTGLWDEAGLAGDQQLIVGGWFAAPEPDARAHFMQAYKDTYAQDAPRLATLAYDATALALVLARTGARYDTASLTSPSGFSGLDGIFRLTTGGQIERGLAVLEVERTQNQVIDPSPSTFSGR